MAAKRHGWLPLLILGITLEVHAWDNLGRLFTTPEQRERIDAVRFGRQAPEPAPEHSPAAGAEPWVFDGVLVGSEGRRRVWIRGPHPEIPVTLRPDGSVLLELPVAGVTVRLKPGQGVDPLTGRVMEPWEMRARSSPATVEADAQAPEVAGAAGEGGRDAAREEDGP